MQVKRKLKQTASVILWPVFKRYVCGAHADDAIKEARKISSLGGKGLINFLGEQFTETEFVQECIAEYNLLIDLIAKEKKENKKFNAEISIKPSQFGFDLKEDKPKENEKIAFENMHAIVKKAIENQVEVEIDMEESQYVDFTIEAYKSMLKEFRREIKVCLQANLMRTEKDLLSIAEFARENNLRAPIRLVKGVYLEQEKQDAFHTAGKKIENFKRLLEVAFEMHNYLDISIGTNRTDIIELSEQLSKKTGAQFELQMLKGIREKMQKEILANHHLTIYMPYGKDMFEYCKRRIKVGLRLAFGNI